VKPESLEAEYELWRTAVSCLIVDALSSADYFLAGPGTRPYEVHGRKKSWRKASFWMNAFSDQRKPAM